MAAAKNSLPRYRSMWPPGTPSPRKHWSGDMILGCVRVCVCVTGSSDYLKSSFSALGHTPVNLARFSWGSACPHTLHSPRFLYWSVTGLGCLKVFPQHLSSNSWCLQCFFFFAGLLGQWVSAEAESESQTFCVDTNTVWAWSEVAPSVCVCSLSRLDVPRC